MASTFSSKEVEFAGQEEGLLDHTNQTSTWRRRARVRPPPPPKTTLAAVIMLILGTIFLVLTVETILSPRRENHHGRAVGYLVLGCILFIPGSYSSFVLYGAWAGWRDFDYSMVPSYDE